MAPRLHPTLIALAVAASLPAAAQQIERITIIGSGNATIGGFGAVPLAQSPFQASLFGAAELTDAGVSSLAGLTRLDASLSDAYNSEGYWSFLSVRGFVLDNRSNYRRDGLPINAETALALENKERVEVLKGTSGIQAGVSAPGGLVNLVVKRPAGPVRAGRLEVRQGGSVTASVDLGDRFGDDGRYGLRVNAALAELRPQTREADGQRRMIAVAGDVQLTPDSRLEAEIEHSHQSQPSVPGFSLRGDALPDADDVDPRINLNNQPWSLPVVLDGTTGSLRWRQRLGASWQFTAHAASQRLSSDDRVAFPFGCYDAGTDIYWADRYCPDGSFDLYDFRSENERRRVDALDLQFAGTAHTGAVRHELSTGVLLSRTRDRFQRQAYNYVGTGRDDGSAITAPAPELTDENTNRDERSTEFYVRDAMQLTPQWSLWAGLRHSRLQRESARTDGSRPIDYTQSFTTPWLGLGYRLGEQTLLYTSWGEGVETDVAPNRSRYVNAGQPLPALKTRQFELGLKHSGERLDWSLIGFRIERPLAADFGSCDVDASCLRRTDGSARHQGLEAALALRSGPWTLQGSALWLDAERTGAEDPASNGLRPINVPDRALKLQLARDLSALPGAQVHAALVHEGERMVLPDNSIAAPAWTTLNLGARGPLQLAGSAWLWRVGVDNVTDARAWRDTPYQFGHAYLFPLAPRTWRVSLETGF